VTLIVFEDCWIGPNVPNVTRTGSVTFDGTFVYYPAAARDEFWELVFYASPDCQEN